MLRRYLGERVTGPALVVIMGDHQPSAETTGQDPSWAVPIHVLSRDPAAIEPFIAAGYTAGMHPQPQARQDPPAGMESFLPTLLERFSTRGGPAAGQP